MQAYGLKTHIWNNNLRCILLLCLFPVLLLLLAYAGLLLFAGFGQGLSTQDGLVFAAQSMPAAAPIAIGLSAGWFSIAFLGHQKMINAATKATGAVKAGGAARLFTLGKLVYFARHRPHA